LFLCIYKAFSSFVLKVFKRDVILLQTVQYSNGIFLSITSLYQLYPLKKRREKDS